MRRGKRVKKGALVLRSARLLNDDQELLANSVGRVSGSDGSMVSVRWLGYPKRPRIPVALRSLKSLDGQAGRFDAVLDSIARIRWLFLRIKNGDPPHLHKAAICNRLRGVRDQVKSICPEAEGKVKLAVENFNSFCETEKPDFADWFMEDLSDIIKAMPWIAVVG